MAKGRPPLNPRIEALEAKVAELGKAVLELNTRLANIELPKAPSVNNADTNSVASRNAQAAYDAEFARWTPSGR